MGSDTDQPESLYSLISVLVTRLWANSTTGFHRFPTRYIYPATPEMIKSSYEHLSQSEGYRKVKDIPRIKILGTWDDHDYGRDDGDGTYIYKDISKQLLLDFLDEPPDSKRRSPEHLGVYDSHLLDFGEGRRVKVFLLDTRYNKDSSSGDLLGEQQWDWLREGLYTSTANINIIASSIQLLVEHRTAGETWISASPQTRQRLLDLIMSSNVSIPIVISGDVHFAEMAQANCHPKASSESYAGNIPVIPLIEITSSGMTHTIADYFGFNILLSWALQSLFPFHYTMLNKKQQREVFIYRNIGELEFLWKEEAISFKIFNDAGIPVLKQYREFPSFSRSKAYEDTWISAGISDFNHWVCEPHLGTPKSWEVVLAHIVLWMSCLSLFFLTPLCVCVFILKRVL